MTDGRAKVSSAKMRIDNRNLAMTLADLVADDHNNSMSDVQSVEDKIKDLIITEKGKLKWRGDLITLQLFLDESLNIRGNWTTASGAKTLKNENVITRWYSYNESLTIGGSDAEKVKLYLESRAMTNIKADISETDSTRQKQNEYKKTIDLHNDSTKTNSPSPNDRACEPENSNLNQHQLLNDLYKFVQRIDDKVTGISHEVNNLKRNIGQTDLSDTIRNLKQEIAELKNENLELRQKNATLSYVTTDLQTKVIDLENEKSSLITAIKLTQQDQSNFSGSNGQVDSRQNVGNKESNVNKTSKDSNAEKATATIANINRYEVFNNSDAESTKQQIPSYIKPTTSQKNHGIAKTTSQKNYPRSRVTEGPITILRDSMIKMIKPTKLSRSIGEKVNIKTFPGATIDDMNHYMQPTLKKKSPSLLSYMLELTMSSTRNPKKL